MRKPPYSTAAARDATDDKRLERLYDYTKFHIGIYLSAAGGVAALLGSKDAGWVVSTLIGNQYLLYASFLGLVVAGMCAGVVATGITECRTFEEFWLKPDHAPSALPNWKASGQRWVGREHQAFWLSLILLAASVLIRWPVPQHSDVPQKQECCCRLPNE